LPIPIRIASLSKGTLEFDEPLLAETFIDRLGEELKPVEDEFRVGGVATVLGNVIEVRGQIKGTLNFTCSRCGEPLRMPIDTSFEHRFVAQGELRGGVSSDSQLDGTHDIDLSEYDGVEVDVAPVALDSMIVNLPVAPSCPQSREGPCEQWSAEQLTAGSVSAVDANDSPLAAALRKIKL